MFLKVILRMEGHVLSIEQIEIQGPSFYYVSHDNIQRVVLVDLEVGRREEIYYSLSPELLSSYRVYNVFSVSLSTRPTSRPTQFVEPYCDKHIHSRILSNGRLVYPLLPTPPRTKIFVF